MEIKMQATIETPNNSQRLTHSIFIIGMLFICLLISSNICAFKVVEFSITKTFSLELPAAVLFFPLTYLLDDVITEVYGFRVSRLIIWTGLISSGIITACISLAVSLPASPLWNQNTHNGQSAFELVLSGSNRIFLASSIAYFFGEFLNSIILAKLKVKTQGKYFLLRIIGSTAVGASIDTTLFCHIAFFNVLPETVIWKIILTLYVYKLLYETVMSPVTYFFANYLKKIDNIDYYDTHTKFSPFSLRLN
jgi:uncharacterized integral membrane protein (TIGR00697 family)